MCHFALSRNRPPTGHTIRLLQLPGAWSSFIESNPDGASCLGPMAGLEKQREQYAHAVEALSDPERTRLVLVARLQKSTLQEVARTHDELSAIGLKNQYLVINGVLPASEAERDALAAAIWGSTPEPPKFPLRHFSPPASASKGLFGERK